MQGTFFGESLFSSVDLVGPIEIPAADRAPALVLLHPPAAGEAGGEVAARDEDGVGGSVKADYAFAAAAAVAIEGRRIS